MATHQEKRHEQRFALEIPVRLETGTGMSRDISESGIYFVTDQAFSAGREFRFSVVLDHIRPGKPVQLDCRGQVLRVEPSGDRLGVAASISHFWCIH